LFLFSFRKKLTAVVCRPATKLVKPTRCTNVHVSNKPAQVLQETNFFEDFIRRRPYH